MDFSVYFQSEVEDTLKRIQSHRGVQGLIVINSEGKQVNLTLHLLQLKYCSHIEHTGSILLCDLRL